MKHVTKRGILAGIVLETMSEDVISIIQEQQDETKPSRISNKVFNKKHTKKSQYRKSRNEEDDSYN